jgi:hypothetical protein
MQLKTLILAILPALALANDTTTCTSTTTMTKTVTLQRVVATAYGNGTAITPTGAAGATKTPISTVKSLAAGLSLDNTHYALAGVAGMVVAALM